MAKKDYMEKLQKNMGSIGNIQTSDFDIFDKGKDISEDAPKKKIRKKVPIEKLVANDFNLFFVADDEDLDELATAIEKDGVSNTIRTIEQPDGTYRIISGHRRFLAAKKAGLDTVEIWVLPAVSELEEIAAMTRENNGIRKDDPFGRALMVQLYQEKLSENPDEDAVPASKALGLKGPLFSELNMMASELPREILLAGQSGLFTKELALTLAREKHEHPINGKKVVNEILEIIASDATESEKKSEIKKAITQRKEKTDRTAPPALLKSYRKASALLEKASEDLPTKAAGRKELEELCRQVIAQSEEILKRLGE
jgi:ParB/RepB/Spo0J family partition protein